MFMRQKLRFAVAIAATLLSHCNSYPFLSTPSQFQTSRRGQHRYQALRHLLLERGRPQIQAATGELALNLLTTSAMLSKSQFFFLNITKLAVAIVKKFEIYESADKKINK